MPYISFGDTRYPNPTIKTILDELRPGATYTIGQPLTPDADDVVATGITTSQFAEISLDNWNDPNGLEPPTASDLKSEYDRQVSVYNGYAYQRDRSSSYPSIEDQLDMLYWDKVNGSTTWQDKIAEIKTNNPKP